MSQGGGRRLVAIDTLRGIAVLAVLISHVAFTPKLTPTRTRVGLVTVFPDWLYTSLGFGAIGVHLFLVISGFCIHMQWARHADCSRGVDFMGFWKRRLHRLYPPYLVTLALTLVGLFFLFGVIGHGQGIAGKLGYASGGQLVFDLFLLVLLCQNLSETSLRIGNGPLWSLALEEQLYLLYFPLLWLRRRYGWKGTLLLVGGVTFGWRLTVELLHHGGPDPSDVWYVVGPARWAEWALGALAVEAHLGKVKLPRWTRSMALFALLFVVGIILNLKPVLATHYFGYKVLRDFVLGVSFFVLMNRLCERERTRAPSAAGAKERWGIKFLAFTGLFSYSLYLTQVPIMVAVKQVGLRLHLGVPVVLAARIVIPMACAYLFYRLIESRFINASRAHRAPPAEPPRLESVAAGAG